MLMWRTLWRICGGFSGGFRPDLRGPDGHPCSGWIQANPSPTPPPLPTSCLYQTKRRPHAQDSGNQMLEQSQWQQHYTAGTSRSNSSTPFAALAFKTGTAASWSWTRKNLGVQPLSRVPAYTLDGPNRQSPIASVQRTRTPLAGHCAGTRGTKTTPTHANRAISIAAQRMQGLRGPNSVFRGRCDGQRTLVIRSL